MKKTLIAWICFLTLAVSYAGGLSKYTSSYVLLDYPGDYKPFVIEITTLGGDLFEYPYGKISSIRIYSTTAYGNPAYFSNDQEFMTDLFLFESDELADLNIERTNEKLEFYQKGVLSVYQDQAIYSNGYMDCGIYPGDSFFISGTIYKSESQNLSEEEEKIRIESLSKQETCISGLTLEKIETPTPVWPH